VRVLGHRRAPGVQHRGESDASAEMFGIGRDREHGLGGGLEQEVVDHRLVLIGDVGDPVRQREDDMEVRHRQQFGLARLHPFARLRPLALRAMPVAAAVVGDAGVAAGLVLATRDMPAERRGATALDRAHHLQLVEADVTAVGLAPSRPMVAKDIPDLQRWPPHHCSGLRRRLLLRQGQTIERAGDGSQQVGGDLGIVLCRLNLMSRWP